jgi:hypothetical protein
MSEVHNQCPTDDDEQQRNKNHAKKISITVMGILLFLVTVIILVGYLVIKNIFTSMCGLTTC